jgi:pyruvate dehydrogenase E2 component (dihydrolipoamide acetyltransferase)
MSTFLLPDLGEGLQDAEILEWHVAPGDHVVVDQPLVQLETDKAVIDVPSPRSGVISALHGKRMDRIKVGEPLVDFLDEGVEGAPGGGGIVGELPTPATPGSAARVESSDAAAPTPAAAPAVRALAARLGVSLEQVRGTGPGGAITTADIEHARGASSASTGAFEPLSGPRLAMARNMACARDAIAPATVMSDADIETWPPDEDVTARLLRAIAAGARDEPALNGWLQADGSARRLSPTVDVGVAVETEAGLFVPVVRDVAAKSTAQLRADLRNLEAAVRDRLISPAQMQGATIGLSNFGTLGGTYAVMTIPPPQLAILGAGRIVVRPVVQGGQIEARRQLPLSLTFDHRAVTGGEAARFLGAVIDDLEAAR